MSQGNLKVLSMLKPIEEAVDRLEQFSEVEVATSSSRKEIIEMIQLYDGVIADDEFTFDEEIFKRADNLKVVSRVGVGYENIDIEAATNYGVMVTNTPGVMAESVAEHVIMMMLASAKNLVKADREVREGLWEWEKYRGTEVWNGTLGQIGLGRIGYAVAKKASRCFNMRIVVHDPYVMEERVMDVGGISANLTHTLRESDVVSINVPLTEETRNLFTREQFKTMKNSAILVNTSRGKVIDQEALLWALETGEIEKAALDVLAEEPPKKNNPLFDLDNVIFTPHQASNTGRGVRNMFMESIQNLIDALEGKPPKYLINKELLDQ